MCFLFYLLEKFALATWLIFFLIVRSGGNGKRKGLQIKKKFEIKMRLDILSNVKIDDFSELTEEIYRNFSFSFLVNLSKFAGHFFE